MPKFHITKSGKAAKCNATERPCPLKGEHFDSMREAAIAAAGHVLASVDADQWEGNIQIQPLDEGVVTGPNRAVLPAGRYFLGDPCYTAGRDDAAWQQWVDVGYMRSEASDSHIIGGTYNGHPVVASNTAYGDGEYYGSNGVSYSVDAGLIGVVPESVIRGMRLSQADLEGSGAWVEVSEPTALEFDPSDGTIYFGTVAIHTGDNEEEDDEDSYCERCGDPLDNPYDGWCASCADEEFSEDED